MMTNRLTTRKRIGRRGAALIEFVFSLPLFVLVLALTFFFGYAMMNQQHVRSADRYVVWRDVHRGNHVDANQIKLRFFREDTEHVDIHRRGGPHETRRELADVASSWSVEAGEFSEEMIVNRFPHGKYRRVSAEFPTEVPLWSWFTGSIRNHHARDTVEWRRRQAGLSSTIRDSYLLDLTESLENINSPGDSLANEIRGVIRYGW
jgi:hypothetical protein